MLSSTALQWLHHAPAARRGPGHPLALSAPVRVLPAAGVQAACMTDCLRQQGTTYRCVWPYSCLLAPTARHASLMRWPLHALLSLQA